MKIKGISATITCIKGGQLSIDNNQIVNRIRLNVIDRNNWLFAGSLRAGSLGIALFLNQDVDRNEILKSTNLGMYESKETGGNAIRFHSILNGKSDKPPLSAPHSYWNMALLSLCRHVLDSLKSVVSTASKCCTPDLISAR